jgi:predicted methyltransferase
MHYAELRAEWATAPAMLHRRGTTSALTILGAPVMEDWESPYMRALAAVACHGGGSVLEVGFGLGIAAAFIDALPIEEHHIIEANAEVAEHARRFAATARIKTIVHEGFWQDAVRVLPVASFAGVLFDVFPLTRQEVIDGEADEFYPAAARLLRRGGAFTFYFGHADSWIKAKQVFRGEAAKLREAGFAAVESDEVEVSPPPDCEYFWGQRFIVPVVTR